MSSRWSTSSASASALPANNSISQDLLLLEKKRKAKQDAVRDLNNGGGLDIIALDATLMEETLAKLRGKAQQLQNDKWMYQDVQL